MHTNTHAEGKVTGKGLVVDSYWLVGNPMTEGEREVVGCFGTEDGCKGRVKRA